MVRFHLATGEEFDFDVSRESTIADCKCQLESRLPFPRAELLLVFQGRAVSDPIRISALLCLRQVLFSFIAVSQF
jgi:hypothetical protein